jgi:hypothetical protein
MNDVRPASRPVVAVLPAEEHEGPPPGGGGPPPLRNRCYAVAAFGVRLGSASLKIFAQVEPTCLGRGPVV